LTFLLHPKQGVAFFSKGMELLYGGAAGGGKSHALVLPCDREFQSPATKKGRCRLHGGASGSGGPLGERNGQYRHGERTKAAIAEAEIQRIAAFSPRRPDMNT
jgi:hypothetical protein